LNHNYTTVKVFSIGGIVGILPIEDLLVQSPEIVLAAVLYVAKVAAGGFITVWINRKFSKPKDNSPQ
jgi:hypothetical protein